MSGIRSLICRLGMVLALSHGTSRSVEAMEVNRDIISSYRARLLRDSKRLIALESESSLALYHVSGPEPVHRFAVPHPIACFEVSPNERILVIGTSEGGLFGWDVLHGQEIWRNLSPGTGLYAINGLSFDQDSCRFVAYEIRGSAVIFDATTGAVWARITTSPGRPTTLSAAMSLNGMRGLLNDGVDVFSFAFEPFRITDTGLNRCHLFSYSADAKYVACESKSTRDDAVLRIVSGSAPWSERDVGHFREVHRVRALPDGAFLVTARLDDPPALNFITAGFRCQPATGELREVWRITGPLALAVEQMDFVDESMVGVATDRRLRTRVIDLRTSKLILEVDNSLHLRRKTPILMDLLEPRRVETACAIGCVLALVMGVLFLSRVRRRAGRQHEA